MLNIAAPRIEAVVDLPESLSVLSKARNVQHNRQRLGTLATKHSRTPPLDSHFLLSCYGRTGRINRTVSTPAARTCPVHQPFMFPFPIH